MRVGGVVAVARSPLRSDLLCALLAGQPLVYIRWVR
jgi:hypothetical protein